MKEIIIDDVNVAECGYFCEFDKECSICGMGTDGEDTFCKYCKDNSNCYFKQLKRLEQENEKLKQQIDQWKSAFSLDTKMLEHTENAEEKYQQALEKIREMCTTYAKTESYIIDETFSEFLEIVFNKANEVLK